MTLKVSLDILHQEIPGNYYNKSLENNLFQKIWHNKRFREVKNFLKLKKIKNILDIGSHGGIFTNQIYEHFPNSKVYGIDISKEAIQFAKKTYPHIRFKISRAENLPFKKNAFDLVSCFEVLEHVENPQIVISEIAKVMKKKGYLVIMVPTENFIFRTIWFFWSRLGPGRVWKDTHIQKFQKDKLDKLLLREKLIIEKRKLFLLGMLLLILARKN